MPPRSDVITAMYPMKQASLRDLRYEFKKIDHYLRQGETVQITRRHKIIARLVPEPATQTPSLPNFLARLRTSFGNKKLKISGAQLLDGDRSRY